jgi:hypothetical protein
MNMSPVFAVAGNRRPSPVQAVVVTRELGLWHHFGVAWENQEFIDRLDSSLTEAKP